MPAAAQTLLALAAAAAALCICRPVAVLAHPTDPVRHLPASTPSTLPRATTRVETTLRSGWRFFRGDGPAAAVDCPSSAFPQNLTDIQCFGLANIAAASTTAACRAACCNAAACQTWQFCPAGAACVGGIVAANSCWIGQTGNCRNTSQGWIGYARNSAPPPPPSPFVDPAFDDSAWATREVPHDFSIEDLPPREADDNSPTLALRNGTWLFHRGDNSSFSDPGLDDSHWQQVQVPHDWRAPPTNYNASNAYGWYRRHFRASAAQLQAASLGRLQLALGTVAALDDTFINGHHIGSQGLDATAALHQPEPALHGPLSSTSILQTNTNTNSTLESVSCEDYLVYRAYPVPANILHNASDNVVAVRVFSPGGAAAPGGLYDASAPDARIGPFDAGSSPGQKSTGYTVAGVAWYRLHLSIPASARGQRLVLRFDGVYMNSDCYFNGRLLGNRPYGYVTFEYDITELVDFAAGGRNVLVVRVASEGSNSRWYAGAGIYRHVHLTIRPPVHIPLWGAWVRTPTINLAARTATVDVELTVANTLASSAHTTATLRIFHPDGSEAVSVTLPSAAISANTTLNLTASLDLSAIQPWSTDSPNLYTLQSTLDSGDELNATFGLRTLSFSVDNGFLLNGVPTTLYGGCVHHANGPLGSRAIPRADERRVELLKAVGYNAIRTSHNPVSPAFLDACDRLGVLVMEEAFDCFDQGKKPTDYHLYFTEWWQRDMQAMVLRDRNRPSIVMWSIGNEIPVRDTPHGAQLAHQLADYVRMLDAGSGRAVTSAIPGIKEADDAYAAALDVVGYNYSPTRYEPDHQRLPKRIMVATESFPAQSFDYWAAVWNHSYVLGDFIWTAMDYFGESSIGASGTNTPSLLACGGYCPQPYTYHISACGDLDVVGRRRPQSFYRAVLWNASQLEMAVHAPVAVNEHEVIAGWGFADERQSWTWPEWQAGRDQPLSVRVYSRYPQVNLFVNGQPVSAHPVAVSFATQFAATFAVNYTAGTLTAKAYAADGAELASKTLVTAGPPVAVRLTADRSAIAASRDDLAFVTAELVDAQGRVVPRDGVAVSFALAGDGEITAVGSGDPIDPASLVSNTRRTYRGSALAILQPAASAVDGSMVLTASSAGLKSASVTIRVG